MSLLPLRMNPQGLQVVPTILGCIGIGTGTGAEFKFKILRECIPPNHVRFFAGEQEGEEFCRCCSELNQIF